MTTITSKKSLDLASMSVDHDTLMVTDILGNQFTVGDYVAKATMSYRSASLRIYRVVGIEPKFVLINYGTNAGTQLPTATLKLYSETAERTQKVELGEDLVKVVPNDSVFK